MADQVVYRIRPPQNLANGVTEVDRAIADVNGNKIDETYATKTEGGDLQKQIDEHTKRLSIIDAALATKLSINSSEYMTKRVATLDRGSSYMIVLGAIAGNNAKVTVADALLGRTEVKADFDAGNAPGDFICKPIG
jgi:hypothetical protein